MELKLRKYIRCDCTPRAKSDICGLSCSALF